MSTVIDLFERHGYVLELLACVAATTWKLERQERFAVRLTGILLAEVCFTIVWEQVPHNLYTESLRTFLLWSIAVVGIRLCFRIAAAWAVFYATAAGTMQHIIYRGAKLLQNAVYHMDRQYWAWSRWVYLGLFVLLFAVCCLTLTRRLHSRNLGTLPGRTMTFIMVGYQLSMNIFVNLFNAFSVDSAPRIFTTYSVYDEVTTILLFFLLCEILQRSDAEWDNMVLQQMMRQQQQNGERDIGCRRRPRKARQIYNAANLQRREHHHRQRNMHGNLSSETPGPNVGRKGRPAPSRKENRCHITCPDSEFMV